jgi:hypothetical protein
MTEQMPDTAPEALQATQEAPEVPKSYDADYVAELRQEAAENRVKAKRAEDLARQAVRAYTEGKGQLIDPEDLAFDPAFLDEDGLVDFDKVRAAIDALVQRKPHLASQRPTSTITQGAQPEPSRVDLHGILRANA